MCGLRDFGKPGEMGTVVGVTNSDRQRISGVAFNGPGSWQERLHHHCHLTFLRSTGTDYRALYGFRGIFGHRNTGMRSREQGDAARLAKFQG